MEQMKTRAESQHKRLLDAAQCSTAPRDIAERARMLKPLAEEAHKILVIGRESNDASLITLSAEVLGLCMSSL